MSIIIPETFTFHVKPTKRYRIVFSIWGHTNSDSISDFDTIEELEEEKRLIKEFYNSTPRPEKIYKGEKSYRYDKRKYEISYENGGCYWGYITLDYQNKKILEIYNDGCMDLFFRTEEDVPIDYIWDAGEYEGWLQFKWGDGKNAVGYVKPEKPTIIEDNNSDDNFDENDVFDEYIDRNEEIAITLEDQLHEETMKRLRNKWYEY